ncbi:hypothetical protein M501DRAFT_996323 [Patellaria atrata CBS 101060]|uniref:Uncharacterized protein n=1 Tax=Patellaria atrata CBS 101060 TaxID=1346257 RepID=A0A9P4S639_9PEZI|nr:hypothetical protein M501DRAFT_996323 [Patellaria atrata CBS 101060]
MDSNVGIAVVILCGLTVIVCLCVYMYRKLIRNVARTMNERAAQNIELAEGTATDRRSGP